MLQNHDVKMIAVHALAIEKTLPELKKAMKTGDLAAFGCLGKLGAHVEMLLEWLPAQSRLDAENFGKGKVR